MLEDIHTTIKTRIRQDFNRAAKQYKKHAALQKTVAHTLSSELLPHCKGAKTLLDIGCGTGYVVEYLRAHKKRSKMRYLQCDIAPAMCQKAATHAPTFAADMDHLPISTNALDIITSSLTFQWSCELDITFSECYRALKPGGILAFSAFGPGTLLELQHSLNHITPNPPLYSFESTAVFTELLLEAGFQDIAVHKEQLTRYYKTPMHLLRSIKGVGGRYKHDAPPLSLSQLKELTTLYEKQFRHKKGIPASWQIRYITAIKSPE